MGRLEKLLIVLLGVIIAAAVIVASSGLFEEDEGHVVPGVASDPVMFEDER